MKTLKVTDHGQVRYVQDYDDDTQTTALAPIDTQKIAREWGDEYVTTMNGMLRQYATPTAPAGNRHPQVTGISSPDELSARNQRFRWTVIALIVLSSITTAGIVLIAVVTGSLTPALGVSFWVALTGISAGASTYHVHKSEQAHSPEAIELERVRGDYDVAIQHGEIQKILVKALAKSVRNESEVKRLNAESQRAQNMSLLERPKPTQAPTRAPVSYGGYSDDYADETPQQAPERRYVVEWESAQESELIVAPTIAPDRDLVAMLAEIDQLYADCDSRDSDVIVLGLAWGNHGDWSIDAKEKAARVLDYFTRNYDTPLFYRKNENGARWRLNRQAWKRNVARAIIAREWGNN